MHAFLSPCHPGPCPPCVISVERTCYCGQESLVMRCSRLQDDASLSLPLSCGRKCSKPLSCGKHVCELECHPGECGACQEIESARCYCGKDTRQIKCGEGVAKVCIVGEEQWEGQFECEALCERPFQCGEHFCQKVCPYIFTQSVGYLVNSLLKFLDLSPSFTLTSHMSQ